MELQQYKKERVVKRVLVMLEYEDGDPDNGEVFDLTALATEIASRPENNHRQAQLSLKVNAYSDYSKQPEWNGHYPISARLSWAGMFNYNSSADSASLDDVINSAWMESERVNGMRKTLKRLNAKAGKMHKDIQVQRLIEASTLRYSDPVCRITRTAPPIAQAADEAAAGL